MLLSGVDTTIPLWEVIGVGGGLLWTIIKFYFEMQTQKRDFTLFQVRYEETLKERVNVYEGKIVALTHRVGEVEDNCNTRLEENKKERAAELQIIQNSQKQMNDIVIRLDVSMNYMTSAVDRLSDAVDRQARIDERGKPGD